MRGHVTRRRLLGGAAVAGAATLVQPKAGLAAAALGRGPVFSESLRSLSGQSPPIRATRPFVLAGIAWSGPGEARIELRAQAPSGRWSPWVTASAIGHDGDAQPATSTRFGEPVWTGTAVAVQLRSDRLVRNLRLHFVTGPSQIPGAREAAALPLAQPVLDAGPGQPPIIARSAWGRGARPRHLPGYGSVKLAFVHHTVNPNGYSAGEVPGMLRAIFNYHVHVRGWWDIGYNFVIDAFGRIWEARAGGIDMAVVGAQAGAYNTESTGVAMLGDFMDAVPTAAARRALTQLIAWKLSLHGVPTTGRVTVVVDPADAFYTRFRPGAHVSLPRVAGHRDGDLTDCPGNALYARLQSLRPRITALAGSPARLTATPGSILITAGATATLSGTLALLSGQPLAGEPIELQELGRSGPPATAFATVTTDSNGAWSQDVSFTQTTLVRALHQPAPASVSDWLEVSVAPVITVSVEPGSPLLVSGTISPPKSQVVIDLYPAGRSTGKPIAKKRLSAGTGSFTGQLGVPGPGDYTLLARSAADSANAAGVSAPVPVSVS